MSSNLPRRRLVDWTPEDGDGEAWLARLAEEGWVPEHRSGSDSVINGRKVRRFAMIQRLHLDKVQPEP
ncbi:MAG: hypothetical protein HOV66_07800 [Streptomycetaceae bacterium]|nr:hypothetical protein [Streptomycetaceae bacterium]